MAIAAAVISGGTSSVAGFRTRSGWSNPSHPIIVITHRVASATKSIAEAVIATIIQRLVCAVTRIPRTLIMVMVAAKRNAQTAYGIAGTNRAAVMDTYTALKSGMST